MRRRRVAAAVVAVLLAAARLARADGSPDSVHVPDGSGSAAVPLSSDISIPTSAVRAPASHEVFGIPVHTDQLRPRWRDVAFVGAAATAVSVTMANDIAITRDATAGDTQTRRDLANALQPLGNSAVVIGGVVAWGATWAAHRPALFAATQRADLSVASAAVCAFALKQIVGRERPNESPNDAHVYDPFSKHDSFPSGHATLAFAAAAALDRETHTRWVPAIGYPLAGLVAWSRIHDRKHWSSDVVAGAALGFGVTWKMEDVLRGPHGASSVAWRLQLEVGHGTLAALSARW